MVSPDADRSVKGGGGMPYAAFGAPIMQPPHMSGILVPSWASHLARAKECKTT